MQSDTRYELPPERTTLLGYLCRRAHKTSILVEAEHLVEEDRGSELLVAVAHYCAAASVSYGRAYYQPRSSEVGDVHREPDPTTGVPVSAELLALTPAIVSRISAEGPAWSLVIDEQISGTTFGFGTLGMPAPSRFEFRAGRYSAGAAGTITTELVPLPGATRVRGHGLLDLSDSSGNRGTAALTKKGELTIEVGDITVRHRLR